MKSLVLMVLVFLGAWYVAGIDQHFRHATVWAPDGRAWHNVTMDRNFVGDLVLTNTNGEKTTVSKRGAVFTYDVGDSYLGLFAWSGIVIAFGYGTFAVFPQLQISFQRRNRKNEKQTNRGSNGAAGQVQACDGAGDFSECQTHLSHSTQIVDCTGYLPDRALS
jgi:hypothetical protein